LHRDRRCHLAVHDCRNDVTPSAEVARPRINGAGALQGLAQQRAAIRFGVRVWLSTATPSASDRRESGWTVRPDRRSIAPGLASNPQTASLDLPRRAPHAATHEVRRKGQRCGWLLQWPLRPAIFTEDE